MGTLIINRPDGQAMIFPNRDLVSVVTKAEQSVSLLGEDVVNVSVESASTIDFRIGCYINVFGKTYTLNQLPSVKKSASNSFSYTLVFEGEQYELMDCAWLLSDNAYGDSFTGNLEDFCKILINENISRSRSDWRLGNIPETETKTLTYSSQNCLQVLQNLCKEFEVEFEIARQGGLRVLNFKPQIGTDFAVPFRYGRTGGAYAIERKTNSNQNVVTKLFAFGSGDNLGHNYGCSRLRLPNTSKATSFITDQKSIAIFGVRENVKVFEKIKPQRTGEVSEAESLLEFTDSSMDFDLNEKDEKGSTKWLIEGSAAKITFQTGNLAGYSFDVNSYNHQQKKFKINQFADENGLKLPNQDSAAFQFSKGDTYIIEGIRVPEKYILNAENELKKEAQNYFDEYCKPHVDYTISLNSVFVESIKSGSDAVMNVFGIGDRVTIIDEDLGVDEKIRVTKFVRNILDVYSYQLTLSNSVQVTLLQRVVGELTNIQQVVQMNSLDDSARAKRNWKTSQEVLNSVFDAEGDYYTEKIKPNSIETQMLAVGAMPQQFVLKGCLMQPNYGGNPNVIHVASGFLEHYTINPERVVTWNISTSDFSDLVSDKAYYIYAKCSKDISQAGNPQGVIIFSQEQIKVDSDPQYYHFLCGVLSSVMAEGDGAESVNPNPSRQVSLTYGSSTINGRYINTGRIQSRDGGTYFDMDKGEIGGNIDFKDSVMTETILIKDGKTSADKPYFCGALSGNENLPVLWVSESKTADEKQVKEFANRVCPVKITKEGVGSNFGCLNIASNKYVEISSDSGKVRFSSDSIANENAALSPITIADKKCSNVTISNRAVFEEFSDVVTVASGLSVEKALFLESYKTNCVINFTLRPKLLRLENVSYRREVSVRVLCKYVIQCSTDKKNWYVVDQYAKWYEDTIMLGGKIGEYVGQLQTFSATMPNPISSGYMPAGKNIYVRNGIVIEITLSGLAAGEEVGRSVIMNGTLTSPTMHFVDRVKANIIAGGGLTSALDSENYFKLYPQSDRLMLDMNVKPVFKTFNKTLNSSYVEGKKWGCVVFIKYRIDYVDVEKSQLLIPSDFRPTNNFDSITYGNQNVYYKTDGSIHPYNLRAGETLWGGVTYMTNN